MLTLILTDTDSDTYTASDTASDTVSDSNFGSIFYSVQFRHFSSLLFTSALFISVPLVFLTFHF